MKKKVAILYFGSREIGATAQKPETSSGVFSTVDLFFTSNPKYLSVEMQVYMRIGS
jgi:hypothetical protein